MSADNYELLTINQAAERINVCVSSIRNYIRAGKLTAYRIAGLRKIRIRTNDLNALLIPTRQEKRE